MLGDSGAALFLPGAAAPRAGWGVRCVQNNRSRRSSMKHIVFGLLALGLLTAPNLGGQRGRLRPRCLSGGLRRSPRRGHHAPGLRLPRRRGGAARGPLLLSSRRARLSLSGPTGLARRAGSGVARDRRIRSPRNRVSAADRFGNPSRRSAASPASLVGMAKPRVTRFCGRDVGSGAADGVAGRVDARDSRLHGAHVSRTIAIVRRFLFLALSLGNSAF